VLKPLIFRRFAFEDAAEALTMVAARQVIGKCLLLSDRGRASLPQGACKK